LPKRREIIATHHAPDLDPIAAIVLFRQYGNTKQKEAAVALFLREGNEALNQLVGITILDRGKGEYDHHGMRNSETTASLVARGLQIPEGEKVVQRLLRKVQRSDLQGESLPFDASDLIKAMQRVKVSNEEIIELGTRLVNDCLEFSKRTLQRENLRVQKILCEFLVGKEVVPPKFQDYIDRLNNPGFERPFDIVEVFLVESQDKSEEEAKGFVGKLLEFEYRDSVNYLKAMEEVRTTWKKVVKGVLIVADVSDNPRFKDATRNSGALITVQRNTNGSTQIYFDTERINIQLVEALISMIRLEECLIQRRKIPKSDLRQPEYVEGIPEWYYYQAPWIIGKKKKPGQFILNGSITAPDVPPSKIPLETLREITIKAVMYQPLNWVRWCAERSAYYLAAGKGAP